MKIGINDVTTKTRDNTEKFYSDLTANHPGLTDVDTKKTGYHKHGIKPFATQHEQ